MFLVMLSFYQLISKRILYNNEDQTILQTPLMDTDQDKQTINHVETRGHLNL